MYWVICIFRLGSLHLWLTPHNTDPRPYNVVDQDSEAVLTECHDIIFLSLQHVKQTCGGLHLILQ